MRGLALALALLGCGPDRATVRAEAARDARYAEAERAFSAGRPDADALLREVEADPAAAAEARAIATYRRAQLAERAGQLDEARARYRSLAAAPPERAALAAWRLARMDGTLRAFVDRWPGTAAADRGVEDIAKDDPDPAAAVAWLEAAAERHVGDTVADNALWWGADASLRRLGDLPTARRLLRRLVEAHPRSPLLDDALWRLGAIYRALGEADRSVATYRALVLARSEESWFVGSYKSERLDDARLMVGRIRLEQGRLASADEAFGALLDEHPTSRLRDDAAWGRVCVAAARSPEAGRRAAEAFVRAHPDSRHARAARRFREGGEPPDFGGPVMGPTVVLEDDTSIGIPNKTDDSSGLRKLD